MPATEAPPRDPTKHEYLIVPMVNRIHRYPAQVVCQVARETTGERKSIEAATRMMELHAEVESVHVYHTHPSPGPVSRYVGNIMRGSSEIVRPT